MNAVSLRTESFTAVDQPNSLFKPQIAVTKAALRSRFHSHLVIQRIISDMENAVLTKAEPLKVDHGTS
jgi:hypothetical protein